MKPYVVGITGASGAVYAATVVKQLIQADREVIVVISDAGRLVIEQEMQVSLPASYTPQDVVKFFNLSPNARLSTYSAHDLCAPIASGSYPVEGMVIVPSSMGTIGALACGVSQHLIQRAADCMLKENRRLVIVPRETPVHAGHLENMLKLARLGARIVPATPAFYSAPATVQDMVDFVAGKILDQMEVPHALYPRWVGPLIASRPREMS